MAATTVQVQMQQRRDTLSGWASANPTLLSGEFGLETSTNKVKIGDGSTAWNSLSYVPGFSVQNYPLENADIADGAITSLKILNGTIVDTDININAFIQVRKLEAGGAPRKLLQTDSSGNYVEWTNDINVPGTLDAEGAATFESTVEVQDDLTIGTLMVGPQSLSQTTTIPVNSNAVAFGPSYTISTGFRLTISTGSFLTIL